jgi:hypothetical protein
LGSAPAATNNWRRGRRSSRKKCSTLRCDPKRCGMHRGMSSRFLDPAKSVIPSMISWRGRLAEQRKD